MRNRMLTLTHYKQNFSKGFNSKLEARVAGVKAGADVGCREKSRLIRTHLF